MEQRQGFFSSVIQAFLKGNLAVLLILISLAAGAVALLVTPREEEPQIVVPLADVMVMYPGGSAEEVEQLVSSRLEKLLYQIDGVEYVYSMSRPGMAVVTVRFFVGEDREDSLIKLYNKIFQNIDQTTPGIAGWVVKPIEIDDVPIVTAALYRPAARRRRALPRGGGGRPASSSASRTARASRSTAASKRVVQVYLDTERLAAYGLSPMEIAGALKVSNAQMESGSFAQGQPAKSRVEAGPFLRDVDEVRNLMVGLHAGPAGVPARRGRGRGRRRTRSRRYTRIGFGPGGGRRPARGIAIPAVTIAVAKKKGSNAVWVAREVEAELAALRGSVIPDEVQVRDHAQLRRDRQRQGQRPGREPGHGP